MPVRKIPKSYRNVTGKVAVNGGSRAIHFESPLEKDFFVLMDFNPDVEQIEEQPVKIPYLSENGGDRSYCPDALIHFRSETNRKPLLCEIKTREELRLRWPDLKPRFKAATKLARKKGWRFKIITDKEIRTEFLENVRLIREYRDYPIDDLKWQSMRNAMRSGDQSIINILNICSANRVEHANILAQIWCHIGSGRLHADLHTKLGYQTVVSLSGSEQ